MTVQDVESLESGEARPSSALRRALMAYFDCNFEELFEVVAVHSAGDDHSPAQPGIQ